MYMIYYIYIYIKYHIHIERLLTKLQDRFNEEL